MNEDIKELGSLFIVATPIGNIEDITLRAQKVLASADAVACEEFREGSTLLKKLGIGLKPLLILNEHNEDEGSEAVMAALLEGKSVALITDCGTPSFADPGTLLVKRCMEFGIPVIPIPGASSLMAALSVSPLPLKEFFFAGFLPRDNEARRVRLAGLRAMKCAVVIMDTPYRLEKLVSEAAHAFGSNRLATLAMNLTLPNEKITHALLGELAREVKGKKGEFILIVH